MAEGTNAREFMHQCLMDAGCNEQTIEVCDKLMQEHNQEEIHILLDDYRKTLMDGIHVSEKEVDCLDYFLYSLKKNINHEEKLI